MGCLLCSYYPGWSQRPYVVRGRITDSSGAALSKASILIRAGQESRQILSDKVGEFQFQGWVPRGFQLQVTMQGYGPSLRPFTAPDSIDFFILPTIVLQPAYQQLEAVTVGRTRALTLRGDTIQFHADAYAMREGSLLGDLVEKLPGVTVDPDSGLVVMGQKVRKMLLDGKVFYGGDVQTALRKLPFDIIDRIELIDDYGDAARLTGIRSGAPEKVLNVVLKKSKSHGFTGIAEGGGGNAGQYISDLSANVFQGERKFSLLAAVNNNGSYGPEYIQLCNGSYADGLGRSWSLTGSGNLYGNQHVLGNSIIQNSYFSTGTTHLEQDNTSQVHSLREHGEYELTHLPNENQTLRITGLINQEHAVETDLGNIASMETDSGFSKQSVSATTNQAHTDELRSETKLYFGQAFPHSGQRVSVDAALTYLQKAQNSNYEISSRTITDSQAVNDLQEYKIENLTKTWEASGALHYYYPAGRKGFLEASYGWQATDNQSDRLWAVPGRPGEGWRKVDSLSNDYTYRVLLQQIRTGYSFHNDKMDLSIGLAAAPGSVASSHDFNWLPDANIRYAVSKQDKFTARYTATIIPPTLQQIQPVTDLTNPQYPITGNPGLNPAVQQDLRLDFDHNSLSPTRYYGFGGGLEYSTTGDLVVQDLVHPLDTSTVVQHTFFKNVDGARDFRLHWRLELAPVFHYLTISSGGNVDFGQSISLTDGLRNVLHGQGYAQLLTLHYNHPDRFSFKWTTFYTYNYTSYAQGAGTPYRSTVLGIRVDQGLYLFREWKLNTVLLLKWNSINGTTLQTTPTYLYATLQRNLLRHKQLTVVLTAANLLNVRSGFSQTAQGNTVIQQNSNLLGRSFLLSAKWMFEGFKQKK